MKKTIVIHLFLLLAILSCVGKKAHIVNGEEPLASAGDIVVDEKVPASPPLIIGSKQYRGLLGDRVEIKNGSRTSWVFLSDPVNCTVEDINNLLIVKLWVDPEDPKSMNSLENLELLVKAKELDISGQNMDKVDFSSISSLVSLEKLEIKGNIARMPDLTKLERLQLVEIKDAALESLDGIGGASIETLNIWTSETNNSMFKISDMKDMPKLNRFWFEEGKIDALGIERFISLVFLYLHCCEPYNLEGIGSLINLEVLALYIMSPNPSTNFLKNLPNLKIIGLHGHTNEGEATQLFDISPLASSKKLVQIYCQDFIIKNISAIDALENIVGGIKLYGGRLYDETEVSKHVLHFEFVSER